MSKVSKLGRGMTGKMNLSIGQKLMGIVLLIIGLLGLVAGTGIVQMQNIGSEIEEIAEQDIPLTGAITAITVHQLEQAINFERLLRYGEVMETGEVARGHFATAFAKFEELTKQVDAEIVEAEALAKGAIEHAATPAAREEFEKVLHALEKIEGEHADYEKHVEHTAELIEAGELTEAIEAAAKIEIEEEQLDHELEAVLLEIEQFTEQSIKTAEEHEAFGLMLLITISVAGSIGGFLLAFFMIRYSVANPIKLMTEVMQKLAGGDHSVEIPGTDRTDEIGEMAGTVQVFKDNAIEKVRLEEEQRQNEKRAEEEKRQGQLKMADDLETSVMGVIDGVSSSATEMQATAETMSATAEETNKQAGAVAAASEEATANVQTVATAAEEMSATIGEISRQVAQASDATKRAVSEAERTNTTVQGVAEAAEKIGAVIELITGIAEQTNLLALNATIEAARAGDAGKGFAVVAAEVKSLANQTAKATEEISTQIAGMQAVSGETVAAIGGIGKTIGEVDEIAAAIAAAIEEQNTATQEIAKNVQEAAAGTQEVSSNIAGVTDGAGETGRAATNVLEASNQLSQQSNDLRSAVEKFLEQVRAA